MARRYVITYQLYGQGINDFTITANSQYEALGKLLTENQHGFVKLISVYENRKGKFVQLNKKRKHQSRRFTIIRDETRFTYYMTATRFLVTEYRAKPYVTSHTKAIKRDDYDKAYKEFLKLKEKEK